MLHVFSYGVSFRREAEGKDPFVSLPFLCLGWIVVSKFQCKNANNKNKCFIMLVTDMTDQHYEYDL